MKKYKLINTTTKEEHLCDKVTIDGFDYYVSDEIIKDVRPYNGEWQIEKGYILNKLPTYLTDLSECRLVIVTNNLNIDIPQILEEPNETLIHQIAADLGYRMLPDDLEEGIKAGYKESQETHPFSEDDMVEFGKYAHNDAFSLSNVKTFKELFQLWKEQQTKIIYYE